MHAIPTTTPSTVASIDGEGSGGAHHAYMVQNGLVTQRICFQEGPRLENGGNGLFDDDLLAIVEDRYNSFQKGSFACEENEMVLAALREARKFMGQRVADRLKRGVLGKNIE